MGSEVARSAFIDAFVAYSRIDGLDKIIEQIVTYPKDEKKERIESFLAQFQAAKWYIEEAERRKDKYLLLRNTTNLLLFGIRMILAYNEMLYSYHKFLMDDLGNAPYKPDNIVKLAEQLLANPSKECAIVFFDCVMAFMDWHEAPEGWCSRFMILF